MEFEMKNGGEKRRNQALLKQGFTNRIDKRGKWKFYVGEF